MDQSEIDKRFEFVGASPDDVRTMRELRFQFQSLARSINELCTDGRYKALALTDLESTATWVNKAVTHKA